MNLLFKYFLRISNSRNRWGCLISNLALVLCILGHWVQPAHAEGSKELTSNGGNRAFLLYHSNTNSRPTIGSIPLKTTIKVYVNAGETINLGSSAHGVGTSGTINYRSPIGTASSCAAPGANNIGKILNRTQELNGPLLGGSSSDITKYTPCIITSAQTSTARSGIWEIDFVSPNPGVDDNPTAIAASGNWTQASNVGWVAAWDVTVRNSSNTGSPFLGRVYSNSLALRMPDLGNDFAPLLYVQTFDGYQYQINPRRLSPYTFVFFANNTGFKSSATNTPLFRSVNFPGGTGLESGVTVHDPNTPDSGKDVTHKIFFNTPDTTLPSLASSASGSTWLYTAPIAPQPSNFDFKGKEGTAGQAGTSPLGGDFSFNSNVTGRFLITLDLNQNGIYGDGNDRVLSSFATPGVNTIVWDGKDGSGAVVPANAIPYGSRITLYAGEIHFPLLDAENNPSGLTIQRLNNPVPPTSPNPDPYLVYFDDTTFAGGSSTAINGVNSSSGAHSWPNDFGNNRGLDTWTYYPSGIAQLNGGVALRQADLEVVSKTHSPAALSTGSTVTYTIVVRNNGPTDVTNAAFTDTVPAQITGVNWSCTVSPVADGNSCGAASGTGNAINTTVNLKNGATATYIVTGTVTGSGTLANTAKIIRTNDVTDPDDINKTGAGNNSKTDTTTVSTAPDLSITKTHTGNFTQGQTGATYTLTATNSGTASTTSNVTVTDTLPSDLIPTAASGTGWNCNISGQTVSCTRTTFTALAAGSSYPPITITVSVVNSALSTVTNTARVSGGGQINNNTINDSFDDPTNINASATPNPISCDGNFYQIRLAGSGSQLFKINRSVNPYTQTQIGNITPDVSLNALGYNKLNGFMYAIRSNTNQLYRIDRNGAVFLGTVSGLPSVDYNTATIDSAGNYYVKQSGPNSTIYKIDVSTRTFTTITLNPSIDLGDMAFHPTDGAIYGLLGSTLYKIALSGTAGSVTTIGNTNISGTSPAVDSVFFDASGALYGYENGGTFYSINTTTGRATQISTTPATSASDGASCAFTSPERVISTAKSVGTVSKVNNITFDVPYTIVVTNTGTDTALNTQITENLNLTFSTGSPTLTIPSGPTVTNGSCTANTGFNGTTDTKLLTGSNTLPIGASGTCTIKFTVRVVYPNQASVPSAAQNNTAYASSTSDSPNPGYTFASGSPIPPPALLASAQSTVSATYPATTNVPNLLLVKRITAINGNTTQNPNDGTALNTFVNDPTTADDNTNWADRSTYLKGAYNGGKVKPGDEVEYTIYFLNTGAAAKNVTLCDRIPDNMTLVPTGYNAASPHPTESGAIPSDTGIGFALNATTLPTNSTVYLTNVNDSDRGRYYPPLDSNTPSTCKVLDAGGNATASGAAANTNGAVVVDIVKGTGTANELPAATSPGTPTNSYGFIRFKAKVK